MYRYAFDFGTKWSKYPVHFYASKESAEKHRKTMIGLYEDSPWWRGTMYERGYIKILKQWKDAKLVKYKVERIDVQQ